MSVRLPDIKLDNGLFTYEGNYPVFIDENGTRHYSIGRSQEQLLRMGMEIQEAQKTPVFEQMNSEIVFLKSEVFRIQEVAKGNFSMGQQLQKAQDAVIIQKAKEGAYRQGRFEQQQEDEDAKMTAYREGRQDQWEEDHLKLQLAFRDGIVQQAERTRELVAMMAKENSLLRRKVKLYGQLVQKAQTVSELNLSPRTSRREFKPGPSFDVSQEIIQDRNRDENPSAEYNISSFDGENYCPSTAKHNDDPKAMSEEVWSTQLH